MTDKTVCLRRKKSVFAASFVIEVPEHLVRDFGLPLKKTTSQIIRCDRPPQVQASGW
jgi:hypothetical protein